MEPSWIQNRSKLEHGLRTYFLKDVGSIFYDFGTHVKIGEVAKTKEKLSVFIHFAIFVVSLLGSFWTEFWMDFGVILDSKLD